MSRFNKQLNPMFDTMVREMNQIHKIIGNEMVNGPSAWSTQQTAEQHQFFNTHEQNNAWEKPDVIVRSNSGNQWTPFRAFEEDPFFSNSLTGFNTPSSNLNTIGNDALVSSVKEIDNNYIVNVPIDDIPSENVKFYYNKDTGLFSVEGEHVVEESDGSKFSSKFTRSISMEPNLKMDNVVPKFENGVLNLVVSKAAIEAAPKETNDDN